VNAIADWLHLSTVAVSPSAEWVEREAAAEPQAAGQFAQEQVRDLVRQIFIAGWPRKARQVVFCAADELPIENFCLDVATTLSEQASANVCVARGCTEPNYGGNNSNGNSPPEKPGWLRSSSRQISNNLWQVPADLLFEAGGKSTTAAQTQTRLVALRREFDYAVIEAPSAVHHPQAAHLGSLCDGVVLVLWADHTRRAAARRARERLVAANAYLFGTVLCGRTFPIPEGLYRRL
jgi:hypothetical protein